jgi:biopolymer transport protein ExbB
MKNFFNVIVIALSLLTAYLIFYIYMGNPNNFSDPETKHEPKPGNVPGMIFTGGPLVGLLMSFVLIAITFIFERSYSIGQARGKGNPAVFIKSVITKLTQGDLDGAIAECDKQRGSMANVLRSAIVRFQEIEHDPEFPGEKKVSEVQRAIDESMNLETPLLEKNLVILSTIASVAVLVGLLGTTLGMIRAFQALAISGTVSAIQLSIGISEALYNTAGGLVGAIIAIVAYNYFTTKVDNFVYMIDEAILNITQIFTVRIKS